MSKLRFRISLSLDGFVAGPNQSLQEPLGGGERLFDHLGDLPGLGLVDTVAAPNVVHLKFVRK